MVDTIRTRAALIALLPNNTTGDFGAQDGRDFIVSTVIQQQTAGIPSGAPATIGDIYFDTTNAIWYIAKGTATVADWIRLSPMQSIDLKPRGNEAPSANPATLDLRNSRPVLEFDTTTQETAIWSARLPATYGGNGLTVEIAWMADTATSGTGAFDGSFERFDAGGLDGDSDSFATAKAFTAVNVPGTSGFLTVSSIVFTNSEIDGLLKGEDFRFRLRRDVANDNAAGDLQVLRVTIRETLL